MEDVIQTPESIAGLVSLPPGSDSA
jgi:hypothetical protein